MKKNRLTKVQRQVRSQRRTATNAELFINKIKNALRLAPKKKPMDKFIEEAKEEIANENLIVADSIPPSSDDKPVLLTSPSVGATSFHPAAAKYFIDKMNNDGIKSDDNNEIAQDAS